MTTKKLLSVVIAICVFAITIINSVAVRFEINENSLDKKAEINSSIGTHDDNAFVEEDTSLRSQFAKHFLDKNGKRYMVVYPEQVHYLDQQSWKEVDNTLNFNNATGKYVSNNESFRTKFSENANADELVSIEYDGYELSWTIMFNQKNNQNGTTTKRMTNSNARVSSLDCSDFSKSRDTMTQLGKASSSVTYTGVINDMVDLRYTVLHNKVEEDLIMYSPDSFISYTLEIETNGLTASKTSDGCIVFSNASYEVFKLAAPWMKDSNDAVCANFDIVLNTEGEHVIITYTPDYNWLHETCRAFPILIDPSFTTRNYTCNYQDTYVYTGDSASRTRPNENTMKVGYDNGKTYYAYCKILNVPELVGGFSADEVTLDFFVDSTSGTSLNLYQVTGNWSPNTITFSNQPNSSFITTEDVIQTHGPFLNYKFDLTSWCYSVLFNEHMELIYSDISEFFASSAWKGFKIGYNQVISNSYLNIFSSEYYTAPLRPVLTIQYTYWPYGAIEDGAVYSFVNYNSGKYLTVDGGNTANCTNIYQYSKNNTESQAFRLDYDVDNNCYRIRAICSDNGCGSLMAIHFYSETINELYGYQTSNVELLSYKSYQQDSQEWIIYPYEFTDLYMIVLRSDPNLALTSYGTGNGTSSGTTSTSTGNVFVSYFTGASNQLWHLESGGIELIDTINIKEANLSYSIAEERTWLSFCCPVMEFGDTVQWHSTNSYSVYVDSVGHIETYQAGYAIVSAIITHSDLTSTTYSTIIYVTIDNGTYYFNNVSNNLMIEYEEKSESAFDENEVIESYNSGTLEPTQRYKMFKIKYLGEGSYSIRSMLDSSMGWTMSGNQLVITTIGATDDIPSSAKWIINSNSHGYYIFNSSGLSKTITGGTSSGDNIALQSISSSNTLQNWVIGKITVSYNGLVLKGTDTTISEGISGTMKYAVYSTFINENGQNSVSWSIINGTGSATINSSTGIVTGITEGTITVQGTYQHDSFTQWTNSITLDVKNRYLYELHNTFGFTEEEANLIFSVYQRVDQVFPSETNLQKAWKCSRILGGLSYDKGLAHGLVPWIDIWNDVAGCVFNCSERDYFTGVLGFCESEYAQLLSAVSSKHNDSCNSSTMSDFAHFQISLASRLAYSLQKTGGWSNFVTGYSDEYVSYLAGWFGDAVLAETNGTTTFGNDDYLADLDAENIYRLIVSGMSLVNGSSYYYNYLSSNNLSRADVFLNYLDYETVRDMVFRELVDKDLWNDLMNNVISYNMYLELIDDEEYHMDVLYDDYYDTYRFLIALQYNAHTLNDIVGVLQ